MFERKVLLGACLAIAALVAIYSLRSKPVPVSFPATAATLESYARYERALQRTVTLHAQELPLDQVLKQLADKAGISIHIDTLALEDASILPNQPVTLDASDVSLSAALKQLLGPLYLAWILKSETMIVTTPEKAGNELIVVVYPARDLAMQHGKEGYNFRYRQLADLVSYTIAPTTWGELGGPGAIHEDNASGTLVVSQTPEVHAQIAQLLTTLREARDAQGISPGATITGAPTWPAAPQPTGGNVGPTPAPSNSQPAAAGQQSPTAPGTPPSGGGFF